jgi:hypothetical protein
MPARYMQNTRARARRLLLALALAPAGAIAATPLPLHHAQGAHAILVVNHDLLAELGLSIAPEGEPRAPLEAQYRAQDLTLGGTLDYALEHGHFVRTIGGELGADRVFTLRAGKRTASLALKLRAGGTRAVAFEWVDRDGQAWFTAPYVHQFNETARIELANLDLRAGPALAQWVHRPALEGVALGVLHVDLPLEPAAAKALDGAIAACANPNWPGKPGYTTDVQLTDVSALQSQCMMTCAPGGSCATNCNGVGANPDAIVKLTPSTRLRNAGTGDVPWYTKFSTTAPPGSYPYASIDQHPFLVWNLYRINALGQLEQIARSGVKHAFATGNEGCDCPDSHVLAPTCADTYLNFTNDFGFFIAPRSEVIASTGVWGRCHSTFDPNCDGVEDSHPLGDYDLRAAVHESELDPVRNAGASYYVDAWYVIRDDANIYNTMGWRTFVPAFVGGTWELTVGNTFQNGAVIDHWVDPASPSATQRNVEAVTPRGRVKLAMKATAIGGGLYRYDYALMNFDFGVAVTAGVEPALEVLRNTGLSGFSVPVPAGTTIVAPSFHDGDRDAADDWQPAITGAQIRWTAPAGRSLDWGTLYRFSFVANAAPQNAVATLAVAETGALADPVVATLGPGIGDTIFADGAE